jgi:hypothetical protein
MAGLFAPFFFPHDLAGPRSSSMNRVEKTARERGSSATCSSKVIIKAGSMGATAELVSSGRERWACPDAHAPSSQRVASSRQLDRLNFDQ